MAGVVACTAQIDIGPLCIDWWKTLAQFLASVFGIAWYAISVHSGGPQWDSVRFNLGLGCIQFSVLLFTRFWAFVRNDDPFAPFCTMVMFIATVNVPISMQSAGSFGTINAFAESVTYSFLTAALALVFAFLLAAAIAPRFAHRTIYTSIANQVRSCALGVGRVAYFCSSEQLSTEQDIVKFRTEFRALRLFYEQDVGTIKAMQFATAAIEPQLESNGNFNLPSVSKLYDMVG